MPTIKTIDDLERLREKAKKVKEMRDQTGSRYGHCRYRCGRP
jgi:hypothetical protein